LQVAEVVDAETQALREEGEMTATITKPRRKSTKRPKIDRRARAIRPEQRDSRFEHIVSCSPLMEQVFRAIEQAAPVESTVLITGESGTGKELVAEAIHRHSRRSAGPYVTVNMAAVPESLVESELFGHIKGAFTGAGASRVGRFEAANGGTLFIDEIGDLQPAAQAKLLRALENRVVTPVGGNEDRDVDVRIVAATNRRLEDMIDEDDFRDDLYYRLNIVRISLPALRERGEDIPLLVTHFIDHFCQAYNRPAMTVDTELMDFLQAHRWPGNVRELRNCIESMVVLADGDPLTMDDVPEMIRRESGQEHFRFEVPENTTLAQAEEAVIRQILQRCGGNRTHAAHKLDISVRTLQRKLARWSDATL
jgi:DNA-binding NtrC family response regulator